MVVVTSGGVSFGMETVRAHPKFDRIDRRTSLLPSEKRSVAVISRMNPAASMPMRSVVPE